MNSGDESMLPASLIRVVDHLIHPYPAHRPESIQQAVTLLGQVAAALVQLLLHHQAQQVDVAAPVELDADLEADDETEFTPIFNGKNLDGFIFEEGAWTVEDGVLIGAPAPST